MTWFPYFVDGRSWRSERHLVSSSVGRRARSPQPTTINNVNCRISCFILTLNASCAHLHEDVNMSMPV